MSRTYKKCPWARNAWFRTPKGKKQALLNNARKGAIPPDSWDEISHDSQCWQPQIVAEALLKKGMNPREVIRHLVRKYGVTYRIGREIVEWAQPKKWKCWPDGVVKVYKEQKIV